MLNKMVTVFINNNNNNDNCYAHTTAAWSKPAKILTFLMQTWCISQWGSQAWTRWDPTAQTDTARTRPTDSTSR